MSKLNVCFKILTLIELLKKTYKSELFSLCRRNRKEPAMAHNLENPCYVHSCDAPPTNDLGGCGEESDYATCHVQDNGNVYVEFGDSQLPTRSGKHLEIVHHLLFSMVVSSMS